MSKLGFLPELVSEFDLETELQDQLNDVPTLSGGLWNDTSANDPVVIALRKSLELDQGLLFGASVRYLPDATVLQLARLKGLTPNPEQPSRHVQRFIVTPGTTVQAGLIVRSDFTGLEYSVVTSGTSSAGAPLDLEVICTIAGTAGNTGSDPLPPIGNVRSIVNGPSVGSITATRDITASTGGRAAETVEEFAVRLPLLIRDETVRMPDEYISEALKIPGIARVAVWRATKPIAPGVFIRAPGCTTVIVMATGGAAPSPSTVTAVETALFAKSLFNLQDATPEDAGLFVRGVRPRAIGVTGDCYVTNQTDLTTFKNAVNAAVAAYLHPETGGDDGKGWELGVLPYEDAIIGVIREKFKRKGLIRVDNDSIAFSNVANFAIDEVVTAGGVGAINLEAKYG
jgi:Baseplate J-like protein